MRDSQVKAPALRLVDGFVSQSPPASRAARTHSPTRAPARRHERQSRSGSDPTRRDPHHGHFHALATIPRMCWLVGFLWGLQKLLTGPADPTWSTRYRECRRLMTTFRVTQRHRCGLPVRGYSAPNAGPEALSTLSPADSISVEPPGSPDGKYAPKSLICARAVVRRNEQCGCGIVIAAGR